MEVIASSNSWAEFNAKLGELGTAGDHSKDKGDAFEELTRLYLLTNPTHSLKIKHIWNHKDIPQEVMDELLLENPEIGVDLVAQVKDGTYWAIQCKFRQNPTHNLEVKEVATFFAVTNHRLNAGKISKRLICTSANDLGRNFRRRALGEYSSITNETFSELGEEEFNAYRHILAGGAPPTPQPYVPREHQQTALTKCVDYFNEPSNTRGKIIHPCGSGKSLTGYWVSQRLNAKTVLLAVPSLALVRQTLGSWTREAVASDVDMDWIAVCSDDDVAKTDDLSMRAAELGIQVDTDPTVIADFLLKPTAGTKVIVTTYQSGRVVSEAADKAGFTFDLGVYDEAHKTVGQKDKLFSHLLFDENVRVNKRVFMTATERQFRGQSDEYLSMDDAEMYGNTIDYLSFKGALEQNPPILSDYKIVSTIIDKRELQELIDDNSFVKSDGKDWSVESDASTLASLIILRKLITERGLKHAVSFHGNIKRSRDFQQLNNEFLCLEQANSWATPRRPYWGA